MPGAGALMAANYLYNAAPKDGTAIAIFQNGTAFEPLLGVTQAKYDGTKFNWIGSLNKLVNIALVWHETPFTQQRTCSPRKSWSAAILATRRRCHGC